MNSDLVQKMQNQFDKLAHAIESCETTGYDPSNHFRGVTKMVKLGSGAERAIDDFMLTHYACLPEPKDQ